MNGTTWKVGDQVLGMGGVMNGQQPIMPRLVAKFGAASATFAPSTIAADNRPPSSYNDSTTVQGNGVGGLLAGIGSGGLMVTYTYLSDYPSYALNPAGQNGAIITPVPGNLYYNNSGVQQQLSSGDYGRVIADFETVNGVLVTQNDQHGNPSSMPVLQSFEVFVDLSDLARDG